MRRTLSRAVGATAVALALGAGPAAAAEPPSQQVTNTNGAAQVAGTDVNAPVRVASAGDNQPALSDGDSRFAPADGGSDPGQSADSSIGTAQVVGTRLVGDSRVLSPGDSSSSPGGSGPQAIDGSVGAVQIGSLATSTQLRVASPGDDGVGTTAETPGGDPVAGSSPEGESYVAPGDGRPSDGNAPPDGDAPGDPRVSSGDGGLRTAHGGEASGVNRPVSTSAPGVPTEGPGGELAFTGLGLALLLAAALMLIAGGTGLRRSERRLATRTS